MESSIHSSLQSTYKDLQGPSLWLFTVAEDPPSPIVSSSLFRSLAASFPGRCRHDDHSFLFSQSFTPSPHRLRAAPHTPPSADRPSRADQLRLIDRMSRRFLPQPHPPGSRPLAAQRLGALSRQGVGNRRVGRGFPSGGSL